MDGFTEWCRDVLYSPEVIGAAAAVDRACDLHLSILYAELGLAERLAQPLDGRSLAAELGFVESAGVVLDQLLQRLAVRTGLVTITTPHATEPRRFASTAERVDVAAARGALAVLRTEQGGFGDRYLTSLDFLDYGASVFVRALRDDPELVDRVLSGREKGLEELWERSTNLDPLQDLHGAMGAQAAATLFEGGAILELGGATGSGVRHLLPALEAADKISRLSRYLFSGTTLLFVLGTKKIVRANWPQLDCAYLFLDLDKPFADQKIAPESIDLVYAVNTAHTAHRLLWSAQQCLAALKPGGRAVFSERVRLGAAEMASRELVVNLSLHHRALTEHHPYRPFHAYLRPADWQGLLSEAGFSQVEVWPDLAALQDHFPAQYAAVIVATK